MKVAVEKAGGGRATVEVGDFVAFKSDVEQSGEIARIYTNGNGHVVFVLSNPHGFKGAYLKGRRECEQFASDCWL